MKTTGMSRIIPLALAGLIVGVELSGGTAVGAVTGAGLSNSSNTAVNISNTSNSSNTNNKSNTSNAGNLSNASNTYSAPKTSDTIPKENKGIPKTKIINKTTTRPLSDKIITPPSSTAPKETVATSTTPVVTLSPVSMVPDTKAEETIPRINLGEVAELDGFQISVYELEMDTNYDNKDVLVAHFSVKNTGNDNISLSRNVEFTAFQDGVELSRAYSSKNAGDLDGDEYKEIKPGAVMQGSKKGFLVNLKGGNVILEMSNDGPWGFNNGPIEKVQIEIKLN